MQTFLPSEEVVLIRLSHVVRTGSRKAVIEEDMETGNRVTKEKIRTF